jgi:NTP pyrophosphatase (non-canonical NTP hydrolase)
MELNFNTIYNELVAWQNTTFPKSDAISKLYHLKEEVVELIEELEESTSDTDKISKEFADCFLLLIGSANKCGFDSDGILQLMKAKLTINKMRNWQEPDENNVYRHIKN